MSDGTKKTLVEEGTETEVVPGVNVSVVWLEDEPTPRVVIADA